MKTYLKENSQGRIFPIRPVNFVQYQDKKTFTQEKHITQGVGKKEKLN